MSVPSISIIGAGNIGSAVAGLAVKAGASTQVLVRDASKATDLSGGDIAEIGSPLTGDIVVLALPYAAIDEVIATYGAQAFAGKVVVDPTNPLDFTTLDSLVPAGSSAAAELAVRLPDAQVVKAFNTVFAAVLATGTVGARPATVLVASDSADAKASLRSLVEAAGLEWADAGELKRAERLEALGALGIALAVTEQIGWTGGLAVVAE